MFPARALKCAEQILGGARSRRPDRADRCVPRRRRLCHEASHEWRGKSDKPGRRQHGVSSKREPGCDAVGHLASVALLALTAFGAVSAQTTQIESLNTFQSRYPNR